MAKKVAVTARTHSQCEGRWHRWRLEAPPCSLPTQLSLWKVPRVCLPNSEKRVLLSPVFLLRGAHLKLSLGFLLGSCRHFLPNSPYWKSLSEKQVFTVHHIVCVYARPGHSWTPVSGTELFAWAQGSFCKLRSQMPVRGQPCEQALLRTAASSLLC